MSRPRRVVVIGGGITGLACAYFLKKGAARDGAPLDLTVLEGRAQPGGNITTEHKGGFVLDGGPDSWIAVKPHAEDLARSLALGPEVIPTLETSRKVYIAWDRDLHPMPEGLMLGIPTEILPMALTPLFSWTAKLRMGLEPMVPARQFLDEDDDESVASFVGRRLGDELTDRLGGPLLGGIFAGDAAAISVRAAFPQLVQAEQKYGSLVRAMRAQKQARLAAATSGERVSTFHSLREGMGSLIGALAAQLAGELRLSANVRSIARVPSSGGPAKRSPPNVAPSDASPARYVVELEGGELLPADDVVLALPLRPSSRILRSLDHELAERVYGLMGYASSATAFFAFRRDAIEHDLDGSGFIVPRALGRPLLAGTWVSSKWGHRAPAGHVLMRAFVGGYQREEILEHDDDELAHVALTELRRLMPIPGDPLFSRVFRFREASAQPHVGHLGRVRRLRSALHAFPGVHLAASGLDGVGIPDCVKQAGDVAKALLATAP